ncbi:TIGR03905 family TSCPD domain-containing protein [Clostridium akagii]|uniref:TIGR03905 family TSCPD domain-containing protein n=1 Tax=Clostridium akagii TaxID=91623 RepID=UPI00047D1A8D|nr:TIGR03905 family TSCPD domain-containing protein [Clostridium akagii]
MYTYKTKGVCSREINFDVVDNKITKLSFVGGCEGNLMGISKLVEGLEVEDAINRLKGIDCSGKGTSCPDQLSKALEGINQLKVKSDKL